MLIILILILILNSDSVRNICAEEFVGLLGSKQYEWVTSHESEDVRMVAALLKAWDCNMDKNSIGATIFSLLSW